MVKPSLHVIRGLCGFSIVFLLRVVCYACIITSFAGKSIPILNFLARFSDFLEAIYCRHYFIDKISMTAFAVYHVVQRFDLSID